MLGIIAHGDREVSDGSDVLLPVRGQSGDEVSECSEEVDGGRDNPVLFADDREAVCAAVYALPGRGHITLEKLMLVGCTVHCIHLFTLRGKHGVHTGVMYTRFLFLRGTMSVWFQSKVPFISLHAVSLVLILDVHNMFNVSYIYGIISFRCWMGKLVSMVSTC